MSKPRKVLFPGSGDTCGVTLLWVGRLQKGGEKGWQFSLLPLLSVKCHWLNKEGVCSLPSPLQPSNLGDQLLFHVSPTMSQEYTFLALAAGRRAEKSGDACADLVLVFCAESNPFWRIKRVIDLHFLTSRISSQSFLWLLRLCLKWLPDLPASFLKQKLRLSR